MSKRITISTGLLLLLFCGFHNALQALPITGSRTSDSLALVAVYDSLDGTNWTNSTNWLSAEPMDNWHGVTVSGGRVTELILDHNHLAGTIPDDIGNLTGIIKFYLYSNQISGTIPSTIGSMTSLKYAYLNYNQLSGEIPATLENLSNLLQIHFYNNQLSGSIPTEICNITLLEQLLLYNNQLSGTIPSNLGNLTNLNFLRLTNNQLTGSIPESIGSLIKLNYLFLDNNQLSGPIPVSIFNTNLILSEIKIDDNQLSGTIPENLGDLPNLRYLNLEDNQLTGSIPVSIGDLSNFESLYLTNNQLSGTIPTSISNLDMNTLLLANNQLTGAVPAGIINNTNLNDLDIANNRIDGLPDFSSLTDLDNLIVQNNRLTFEDIEPNIGVPIFSFTYSPQDSVGSPLDETINYGTDFGFWAMVGGENNLYQWYKNGVLMDGENGSRLTFYPIGYSDAGSYICEITNTVATELTLSTYTWKIKVEDLLQADSLALVALYNSTDGPNWTDKTNWLTAEPLGEWYGISVEESARRVVEISLGNNNLTGVLPDDIGDMDALEDFVLHNNSISSPLPSSMANMTYLWEFVINGNDLTGPIPEFFWNLQYLQYLNLEDNQLTGSISPDIENLEELKYLALGENSLTGHIPDEIGNLTELTTLVLQSNQLTGSIPSSIGNLTKLNGLYLHDNQISGSIPESIGNLTVLYWFYLNDNQLTGSVPSTILNILHLDDFRIHNNQLDELPDLSSLGDMTKLKMENNRFTFADIEPQIYIGTFTYSPQASMGTPVDTTLEEETTYTMEFDAGGTVTNYQWYKDAAIIGGATDSTLSFSPVALSDAGTYTCVITNDLATELTLNTHPIVLSVVKSFFEIDSLALVDLYNNTNGASWDTTTNWLTAEPLENWFGITVLDGRVTQIQLSNNNLAGSIPTSLYDMSALEELSIRHHQLTGNISTNIGKLTNLNFLDLAFGQLSGVIPDELGNCTKLTLVVIDYNAFTGTIPQSLGNLKKLDALYLGGNQLTGTIPDSLCTLPLLTTFHLHENLLTGPIPSAIGNLDSLASLRFEANQISGTIPESIVNLKKLTHLWIQTNQITGAVPTAITGMDSLKSFKIFDNQFTDFPDVSSMVPQLKWVRIWDNKFTFEDIEPNVGAGLLAFNYSPQDSIGEVVDSTITEGDDLTISVSVGGTVNQYQWMKDGTDISGATSNSYMISPAVTDDAGNYVCKITNTIATELTLYSSNYNVTVDPPSDIEDDELGMPKSYAIYQNYPNPFNPTTTIRYDLPKASAVKVHIYNVLGNRVKTVVNGVQTAGRKSVVWNGKDESGIQVASGIYFYQITAPGFNRTMKMLMVK